MEGQKKQNGIEGKVRRERKRKEENGKGGRQRKKEGGWKGRTDK